MSTTSSTDSGTESTSSTHTGTDTTSNPDTTSTKINPEQAVAFAALILADDNLAITPEKLQALLKSANITEVEPIWTKIFANALKNKDVKEILTTVATSGSGAGGNGAEHPPECHGHDDAESGPDGIDIGWGSDSDSDIGCLAGYPFD